MRKYDIFGKKNNASKPLYILAIVFVAVISAYVILLLNSSARTSNLETENSVIQQNINSLLLNEQSKTYQSVDELIPYLPNEFVQSIIYNEIILNRNISGLIDSDNFDITFYPDSENPFDETINTSLIYVKISISFTTDDTTLALDFLDNLISLDRLYYIESTSLDILGDDSTQIDIELYTFYIEN